MRVATLTHRGQIPTTKEVRSWLVMSWQWECHCCLLIYSDAGMRIFGPSVVPTYLVYFTKDRVGDMMV